MPKSGRVYADTPHNRSLGRVGQPFGSAVKPKPDDGEGGSGQGNDIRNWLTDKTSGTSGKNAETPGKKAETPGKKAGTPSKKVGKAEIDLGPGPCPKGHRTGDTRRKKGEVISLEEVDRRLQALGIPLKKLKQKGGKTERISKCVRAAIQKGHIELKGEDKEELNQVIFQCTFEDGCGHSKDVKLCDVLYQPDYAGTDYEDGLQDATVICEEPGCDEGRMYLTRICTGNPSPDSGKFHNHCEKCPGFGVCIGDYREAHCNRCKKHYFRGFIKKTNCPCHPFNKGRFGGFGGGRRFGGFGFGLF